MIWISRFAEAASPQRPTDPFCLRCVSDRRGFTILELITAIAIVMVLAALVSVGYRTIAPKVAKVRCLSNMRSIHVSLSSYVTDVGHWPQIPEAADADNESYEKWWMSTLEPFGTTDKVWQCPVMVAGQVKDSDGYLLKMHYIPADFDANPISPRRWPNMPWLVERGNNHGSGALALFPDGATRPFVAH